MTQESYTDQSKPSNGDTSVTASGDAPKKSSNGKLKRYVLIGLAVVLLAGGGAYFASKRGLSEAVLTQIVDSWIAEQEKVAKQDGTDVDIAYDAIHLEGSFSDHYIVIEKPRLRVPPEGVPLDQAGDMVSTFTTDRIILYPETTTLERVRIELPDALMLFQDDPKNPKLRLKANTPLMIAIGQDKVDGARYTTVNHYIPNEWKIDYLKGQEAQGEEDATPVLAPNYVPYTLTLNEGARYHSRTLVGGLLGEGSLVATGIKIVDANQKDVVSVANINGDWKGVIEENDYLLQALKLNVEDLVAGEELTEITAYLPASFKLDANMSELQPGGSGIADMPTSSVAIDVFDLKMHDTAVVLHGGFESRDGEILPVGKVDVSIKNLAGLASQLQQDGYITVQDVRIIQDAANAILGDKNDLTSNADFAIERTRGQAATIGKTTFDELVATVLHSAMQGVKIETPKGTVFNTMKEDKAPAAAQ